MDEGRGTEAVPGSPPPASERVLAATRLLGTLRAGRLRVERLAEESLDFAALARVLGAAAADDPVIEEVRRTQDLVETRLAIWRELRAQPVVQPAVPALEPTDLRAADHGTAHGAAAATAAVTIIGAAAAASVDEVADGDEPFLIPDEELVADEVGDSPGSLDPDAGEAAIEGWLSAPLGVDEGAVPPDHPDEIATLRDGALLDGPDERPDEAERTLDVDGELSADVSDDDVDAGSPVAAVVVPGPDDDTLDEDVELATDLPDDVQAATDLELSPVEDELDTIHDYDSVAPGALEDDDREDNDREDDDAGVRAQPPTPRLAAWLTDDLDEPDGEPAEDDDSSDDDVVVAAVRVPDAPAASSASADEDPGDDPTRETGLGEPLAVSARVSVEGTLEGEEITGELVAGPSGPRDPESVTSELAAAPAADDFLFDEDVSSSVGLHVAFEQPDTLDEDGDLESEEADAIPRLTDDEPEAPPGEFDDLDGELALEQVEDIDEDLYKQFLGQADSAERRGDLGGAIQAYGDAIDLAPDRREPFLGRGRAHLELGDYSAAMSDFQRAEDIAPGAPEPLVEMGNLYFARKEYRRAIDFYDQALELDAALAMARCRRGICHHYRRNHRAAFQDLQKAYALDPDIPNIRKYVQMAVKAMERDRSGR